MVLRMAPMSSGEAADSTSRAFSSADISDSRSLPEPFSPGFFPNPNWSCGGDVGVNVRSSGQRSAAQRSAAQRSANTHKEGAHE